MISVSVVIITKNEAENLAKVLDKARLISSDIIVVDNGSTDGTLNIAARYGCNIVKSSLQSYGANKNKGTALARHNWVLSIDADEVPDDDLIASLHRINLEDKEVVYDIKFQSYFGSKQVKFGFWGRDHHIRLFNRKLVRWTEPQVHETLIIPKHVKTATLNGYIHHYSVKDRQECDYKAINYAKLSARHYFKAGKKVNLINLYLSPVFSFITGYIIFLGFLDGAEGLHIAQTIFKNKWLKYNYLSQLEYLHKKEQYVNGRLAGGY